MKTLISICILGVALLAISCKDGGTATNTSTSQTATGQMLMRFADPPAGITSVVATLSRTGFTTRTMHLSISGVSASGSFEDVEVGTWHLAVQAFDSTETVRFSGETDVNVQPGVTSNVSLQLMPTSGRIDITVTWGGTPQDPSLLLYLPFNGNANDESGHGNNGIVSGATLTTDRIGTPNSAFAFDGWDNHISIPDLLPDTISAFSMSAWVLATNSAQRRIALYTGANLGEAQLEIGNSVFAFQVDIQNVNWFKAQFQAVTGTFVHLVGVYRRGDHIQIWGNGTLMAETPIPMGSLTHGRSTHHSSVGSYAPEWLDWGRQSGVYSWLGKIDQVRLYSRALSQTEIQSLYQSGQ